MNHLSSPLQNDSSAGEQLWSREDGETVVEDVKCGLGKPEGWGPKEDEVEQTVKGNESG